MARVQKERALQQQEKAALAAQEAAYHSQYDKVRVCGGCRAFAAAAACAASQAARVRGSQIEVLCCLVGEPLPGVLQTPLAPRDAHHTARVSVLFMCCSCAVAGGTSVRVCG